MKIVILVSVRNEVSILIFAVILKEKKNNQGAEFETKKYKEKIF